MQLNANDACSTTLCPYLDRYNQWPTSWREVCNWFMIDRLLIAVDIAICLLFDYTDQ